MIRQRFYWPGMNAPSVMELDTEYGFIVNSDRNKYEFTRAFNIPQGYFTDIRFISNTAHCVWATGMRATKYDLVPEGMIETEKTKEKGTCPKCGHAGTWVRMALKCPEHGVFGGC